MSDKPQLFAMDDPLGVIALLDEIDRLRAGIIKARDALDNYDYDTSLFDIIEELDDLLGDTDV